MTVIEGGHRVGFDVTLSAPKPVSIANAMKIADLVEQLLAERREQALDAALPEVEAAPQAARQRF